ncbi:MAG: hypothetical protein NTW86_01080 [Candidatus Sumerlaeota bacterium]|nr:hypothetical protein [Candidatus Sumerlaeota bacterium]
MTPIALVKLNCVAAGTLNMYIIEPKWLASHGITSEWGEAHLHIGLDAPLMRYRFQKSKMSWEVSPSRLTIESEDPKDDCGKPMAQVLEALSNTPLLAVGCNFHFSVDALYFEECGSFAAYPSLNLPQKYKLVSKAYRFTMMYRKHSYSFELTQAEEKVILAVNVQADVRKHGLEFAQKTAKGFENYKRTVHRLATQLLKPQRLRR